MGVDRILVLSVKAGAGHLRAAQAVTHAIRERFPNVEVVSADALEYTNAAFRKGYTEGYETLVRNLPSVWERIYESLETKPADSNAKKLATLWSRLNTKHLLMFVENFKPDVIACTHFLPAEVLGAQRAKGKLRAPVYTILTDYDIHSMWIQEGVTGYFVASSEMAHALREKGIGTASVEVSGIPILPEFAREYPPRETTRQTLGLNPAQRTVLVAAGGFGMMSADDAVKLLAGHLPEAQFLAVAGRNAELEKRLKKLARAYKGRVKPFGFVDNMHELMAASDLAVSKSGGLTTSECLAMGLPMLVFNPIPGQEERNAIYLLEHGAGLWARTPAQMLFKVKALLDDPKRLADMQEAARRIARPRAAFDIAERLMGLAS
ncbi:MAG TPA: glycosyltransferase [Candidatus Hydrogenedentes bacterium]|jgi:processive 1,2-diacylglycerol beta-glucosyltransferase|nr:glycosyltransferase [FCB group bacterium]HNV20412.1 glycosyltransferase [Candidatus Hydrogenedentota bacterium]HOH35043.1 glycosyltransferase [Candidatus Hydrogenedentota bacterium]HPA05715.1 glycosyltransferase [Candidatus Hydrogenedentota bacterium]HPV36314.1 glycosyltransferase [Candidatus Hydrogenedentota bacterium]